MATTEDLPPTHGDLRSSSQAQTRHMKQSQKYYAFRSGPMSRIGQTVLSIPDSLLSPPLVLLSDPLLSHREVACVRTWTKRDQFLERKWDIWPLDRKDHKVGRRKRGGGCDYVPPRWKMERSMKGRRDWLKLQLEDGEQGMEESEATSEDDEDVGDAFWPISDEQGNGAQSIVSRDSDFDMLSDLASQTDDEDWLIVPAIS